MSTWREIAMGKLFRVEHGYAFKSEYFSESGKLIVLTPGNFHESGGFRLRHDKDRFYQGRFPERYLLSKSDLIVAMTEQGEGLLGSAAFIPESDTYLHNQRLGLVRLKSADADKRFVYYLFNSDYVRQQIRNTSSGAKVRHTSPERIYRVKVLAPERECQRKIGAVLSAYDELIESNERRIEILEKLAENIYREWFVRLRFPGHHKTKLAKGVPDGWEVRPLNTLGTEIKQGVKKRELADDEKYLGLEHIPRRSVAIKEWATGDTVESNKLLFRDRDILFGKIRPYLHKVALAHFSGACSSDTIIIRPKEQIYEGYLLFTMFSNTFIELAAAASTGTKMPRADWSFLKKLEVTVPGKKILEDYQGRFEALFSQIVNLLHANQALTNLRERLLPRLISGKLSVESLDIQFPPSMRDEINSNNETPANA